MLVGELYIILWGVFGNYRFESWIRELFFLMRFSLSLFVFLFCRGGEVKVEGIGNVVSRRIEMFDGNG